MPLDFYPANLTNGGVDNATSPLENYLVPNMFLTPEMMAIFAEEQNGSLSLNTQFNSESSPQHSVVSTGGANQLFKDSSAS
jgi:hypothetical protein